METPQKYEDLTEKILTLLFAFNERIQGRINNFHRFWPNTHPRQVFAVRNIFARIKKARFDDIAQGILRQT